MRVLFLHSRLSGYFVSCLSALKAAGAEVAIIARPAADNAPFRLDLTEFQVCFDEKNAGSYAKEFEPDCVVLSGWWNSSYMAIATSFRRAGKMVVMTSDQPWEGTLQQKLKLSLKRSKVANAASHIWIAGQPQYPVATYLGFEACQILTGVYACDPRQFDVMSSRVEEPPFLLFGGRVEPEKGLDVMIAGYLIYSESVAAPWPLRVVGSGSLVGRLSNVDGISAEPFVQPMELPKLLRAAAAFVLPSQYEPWGVVVQEAAAAGLPLICSDACGAAYHLLQNNFNGLSFRRGSASELAQCFVAISELPEAKRKTWGEAGRQLACQFTPPRWAQTLVYAAERFR